MVLAGQFRRACAVSFLGAAIACLGIKAMSDHVSGQKSIVATFNTNIEVIIPDRQKIRFGPIAIEPSVTNALGGQAVRRA